MNTKNVVIAGFTSLLVSCVVAISIGGEDGGSNKVAKVPTVSADVPHTVELPFLYSQKPVSFKVTNLPLTKNVQKDETTTSKKVVSKVTSVKEEEKVVAKAVANNKAKASQTSSEKEGEKVAYGNVPLDGQLQNKIKKFAESKGIPVTLVYAVMAQESKFNTKEISKTHDYGIMQINRSNFDWLTEDLKKEYDIDFTWSNPYENAVAGIHYLALIKGSWEGKVGEDELIPTVLLSYNMGTGNANKYLKKHSPMDWKYVKNIITIKKKIEKGEKIVD